MSKKKKTNVNIKEKKRRWFRVIYTNDKNTKCKTYTYCVTVLFARLFQLDIIFEKS